MKKAISILLMLLMVVSIVPLAFAEEDTTDEDPVDLETTDDGAEEEEEELELELELEEEVDEETQEEVEAMTTLNGAEMRLLQLEKSITRNIEHGKEVIAKVQEDGGDSTDLELIIERLEALLVEVQAVDSAAEDAVSTFVDLKKDAIGLSKEFRDAARGILKDKAEVLRNRLRSMKQSQKQQKLQERIREKARKHNAENLADTLEKLGFENKDELLEQLKNAEATIKDIRAKIQEKIKEMTPEEKKEAFSSIKKKGAERADATKARINNFKKNVIQRKETRTDARFEKLQGKLEGKKLELLKKQREKNLENLKRIRVKAQEIREKRQENQDTVGERLQQRKENRLNTDAPTGQGLRGGNQ